MESAIRFTHKVLIEKCKTNHRSSQYQLYSLYVDAMYNTAMRMLDNKEDAEDVVQESFVQAFKHLPNFRYESSIGAWLKRIIINNSINFLKMKKIEFIPMQDNLPEITEDIPEVINEVELSAIKRGINELPNGYRQIINLYLIEGYDHLEIAEILGISSSTSKSQYSRAKKKLSEIIQRK